MTELRTPDEQRTMARRTLRALRADRAEETVVEPAEAPAEVPSAKPAIKPAAPSRSKDAQPRAHSRARVVAMVVAAVVSAAFAVVSAVVWWNAGHGSAHQQAVLRDKALLAARLDAATLNTLDYRHAEAAMHNWAAVATGDLADQVRGNTADAAKIIAEAKTSTRAQVEDAAISSIDFGAGTASVLVSLDVTKTPAKGTASTSRNRYLATMRLVGGAWKISNLQTVEVQVS